MEKFCYINIINVGRFVCRLLNWRAQGESAKICQEEVSNGFRFTIHQESCLNSGFGSTGPVGLGAGASTGLRETMHSDMNFKSIPDSRIKEPCGLGGNWALTLNLNRYLKRLCFGTSCNQRWPKCQAHQL